MNNFTFVNLKLRKNGPIPQNPETTRLSQVETDHLNSPKIIK